ncbi:hypothetical protein [Nitrosomonas sp. Nm132]|uniref:hypothetical protein n=1 Tax=Nitrosomonas sp. Nm132 TaxID=1881053 RepID=UPI000886E6EC|nr:hypothetical protein [Nitrosomonas sp. Nm132]SDH76132.1 hypothetical protein SAMN05428952_102929 [Nitrosomonas sp. Nm132]
MPEIEEQSRIVDAFDNLDEYIRLENDKLTKMGSLKRGLMHDLLTGKRRVTRFLAQAATRSVGGIEMGGAGPGDGAGSTRAGGSDQSLQASSCN